MTDDARPDAKTLIRELLEAHKRLIRSGHALRVDLVIRLPDGSLDCLWRSPDYNPRRKKR
jgi:hypothetical protein